VSALLPQDGPAPVLLAATVARRAGVTVLVPLDPGGETCFVETGEPLPEGNLRLWLTEPPVEAETSADRDASLEAILATLWPASVMLGAVRLQQAHAIDNRVDMEGELCVWADLLAALLAWWSEQDERFRRARLAALQEHDPLLAALLHVQAPARAQQSGPRTAAPVWQHLPGFFLEPAPQVPPPDAAAWAAWTARNVEEILGESGGLARLLGERFEVREGQIEMAQRAGRALDRREHLMVEAGTGIGKSAAYLVAALLHAARNSERTIVSTYTKALQHQLVEEDLPLLARLGYPGRIRLLLGRSNYLCTRQLRRALLHHAGSRDEAHAQLALALWHRQSRQGRRVELAEHPFFEEHWAPLFDSLEPCSPHICHRDPGCFVVEARRKAKEADVVVVNHSLLMMDLKSAQSILGPSRILIVDEGHELPEVATRALSHWVARERQEIYRNLAGERHRPGAMREVLAGLAESAHETALAARVQERAAACDRALDVFQNAFASWFSAVESSCVARLGAGHARAGRHRYHDGDEAFGPVRVETQRLLEAADRLDVALAEVLDTSGALAELAAAVDEERDGLASLLQLHRELTAAVRFCLAAADQDWVYWVEWGGERGLIAVVAAPLTVEQPLAALWDAYYRTVVMTSATLAVGDDFTAFAEAVGFTKVSRFTDSLVARSPFHYDEQALVLTTPELPGPDDAEFPAAIARVVARIARRVPTKTLVLSTSYQLIEKVALELAEQLALQDDDLFRMPEGPLAPELLVQTPGVDGARLAERFRRAEAAVLLATGSFWEGVDFPGRELEVLVVPRLPFGVPTEPLTEGRYERARRMGRDPFQEVALVDAVLRLKQGIGRLLRSREDRGVVLLLDQRLQARAYGVTFLQSLPRTCELVPTLAEMGDRVVRFLRAAAPAPARSRAGRA
jgi:ATP-dependent DNA helicase DinG